LADAVATDVSFLPNETARYVITATSIGGRVAGPFTLRVTEEK
jgi:hypothetical protein